MAAEASPGDQTAILYKQGRAEELYGGSEPAASSNFSRAMDLALGDAAARWGSVLPPQLVSAWSDASGAVSRRVLSVGTDSYAAAPVPNTGQQVCAERCSGRWTKARVSWQLCCTVGSQGGSGPGPMWPCQVACRCAALSGVARCRRVPPQSSAPEPRQLLRALEVSAMPPGRTVYLFIGVYRNLQA